MRRLLLIVGLPGSGKTKLAQEIADYKTHIVDDISCLSQLPKDNGQDIVICDVNWCDENILRRAQTMLKLQYPEYTQKVIYFRNEPQQCRKNVARRNDGRNVEGTIRRFTRIYYPPLNAYPVWRHVD